MNRPSEVHAFGCPSRAILERCGTVVAFSWRKWIAVGGHGGFYSLAPLPVLPLSPPPPLRTSYDQLPHFPDPTPPLPTLPHLSCFSSSIRRCHNNEQSNKNEFRDRGDHALEGDYGSPGPFFSSASWSQSEHFCTAHISARICCHWPKSTGLD